MPSGTSAGGQDRIRTPDEKDLQQLFKIDHASFGEDEGYPFFFLRQLFDAHRHDFLLLERDGELCGYALPVIGARTDQAWLLALGVHPDHQGQGCGRALLEAAVRHVQEAGARRMDLVVRPDNDPALRLYRSCGFIGDELHVGYYGAGRDRILMSRDLCGLDAPPEDRGHASGAEGHRTIHRKGRRG